MKTFVLIVLLAAVLATAGCTGGDQAPAATTTTHPVPTLVRTTAAATTAAVPAATTPAAAAATSEPATPSPTPAGTAAAAAETGAMQAYANKDFGFTMQVPSGWKASGAWVNTAASGKKYKVTFTDEKDENLQYVSITPGASGMNLNDWYNIYVKQFKADPAVTITSEDTLQLGGSPAKRLLCTTKWSGGDLESTIVMTVKGDNAYFLEFTSRKDQFPAYSQLTGRILDSFTFT